MLPSARERAQLRDYLARRILVERGSHVSARDKRIGEEWRAEIAAEKEAERKAKK